MLRLARSFAFASSKLAPGGTISSRTTTILCVRKDGKVVSLLTKSDNFWIMVFFS
jgi:hypothetical protein